MTNRIWITHFELMHDYACHHVRMSFECQLNVFIVPKATLNCDYVLSRQLLLCTDKLAAVHITCELWQSSYKCLLAVFVEWLKLKHVFAVIYHLFVEWKIFKNLEQGFSLPCALFVKLRVDNATTPVLQEMMVYGFQILFSFSSFDFGWSESSMNIKSGSFTSIASTRPQCFLDRSGPMSCNIFCMGTNIWTSSNLTSLTTSIAFYVSY